MKIKTLKLPTISPGQISLAALVDTYITDLESNTVVAITSKIVSLCEGAYIPVEGTDLKDLIRQESSHRMLEENQEWDFNFTITHNTLIPNAGIDRSNADNVFVLWPKDPQASANAIRQQLVHKFGLQNVGVVITDSTVSPLRRGVSGVAIAHSGFSALRNYVGTPDLFGRPFTVSQSDISGGLAAAAVLAMGEGAESTPIALISNLDTVDFTNVDPTTSELAELKIALDEDLYAPFFKSVSWTSKINE